MPKVKRYKYKNIAAALAILLLIILGISTSCSSKADSPKKISDSSSNSSAVKADSSSKKAVKKLTGNYMYVTAKNKTDMVNGDLILVNGDHSFIGTVNNTDTVYSYLFDKNGSQIMSTSSTQLTAKKETFEAFSKMGNDFYADKKISTLMINTALPATSMTLDLPLTCIFMTQAQAHIPSSQAKEIIVGYLKTAGNTDLSSDTQRTKLTSQV